MRKISQQSIIDGKRVLKAYNVKKVHPIYLNLAESLTHVDRLQFIKIYNERLCASNLLSKNKKKEPISGIGKKGVIGVELLIDTANKTIQFYSITSDQKRCGEKIVRSIVNATPINWTIVVVMDWSGGFWEKMIKRHPRIIIF